MYWEIYGRDESWQSFKRFARQTLYYSPGFNDYHIKYDNFDYDFTYSLHAVDWLSVSTAQMVSKLSRMKLVIIPLKRFAWWEHRPTIRVLELINRICPSLNVKTNRLKCNLSNFHSLIYRSLLLVAWRGKARLGGSYQYLLANLLPFAVIGYSS